MNGENIYKTFSDTERKFYKLLVENRFDFECQVPVENGRYKLDFVLKGNDKYVNIELDGRQHDGTQSQDAARDKRIKELGYEVFRFPNQYIKNNASEIISVLKRVCSTN